MRHLLSMVLRLAISSTKRWTVNYVRRYLGGPADGRFDAKSEVKNYPEYTYIPVHEFDRIAIYKYEDSHVASDTTERFYRFVETVLQIEGHEFLKDHGKWFPG